MKLSLVIPILNEEDNIKPLLTKIRESLDGHDYEVILVDDGSTDETVERVKQENDARVKLLVFWKNYGQTAAMSAGINKAEGDYIITLDGDLQNDPSDIPAMIEKLETEGWDVVAGFRQNRKDGFVLRKIPSKIANAMIRKLTDVYIRDYGCTLKVFKKDIAKGLGLYGELHRFIPVLARLEGAKMTDMPVKHHPRIHGTSKYGIGRTFKVMSDLLLMVFFQKYLQRPIHLFGPLGIFSLFSGSGILLYLLVEKIIGFEIGGRPLLILGALLFLAGIQFITFGLIAELIMRTYFESQNKKTYRIKETIVGNEKDEKVLNTPA
ncbi:MAG: glycosyltransferase family 2 protein [Bacteroidota bacterium]